MRKTFFLLLVCQICFGAGEFSSAAGLFPEGARSTVTVYLENDIFSRTDQNYTHGCGVAWISGDFAADRKAPFPTRPFFNLLSLMGTGGGSRNISLSLRQNIYTPENIDETRLIRYDQPYAGVTFFPIGFHEKNFSNMNSLELDIGMIGPHSYADRSQKKLHELLDSKSPNGWNNQINDEFIVNINFDRRWRLLKKEIKGKFGYDILPHLGGGIGNMRSYFNAGAQARFGWALPDNFGSYIIQPGCECAVPDGNKKAGKKNYPLFSFHLYTTIDGQAVLRDIFLDGNTFRKSHKVEKLPLVGALTLGSAVQVYRFKIDYSYVILTKMFRTQNASHLFGGITLSLIL